MMGLVDKIRIKPIIPDISATWLHFNLGEKAFVKASLVRLLLGSLYSALKGIAERSAQGGVEETGKVAESAKW